MAGNFHLDKWFLDFVGPDEESMIFYSARLTWHGVTIPYTSCLTYQQEHGNQLRSRFKDVKVPTLIGNVINWEDSSLGVRGTWENQVIPLSERLIDEEEGFLDWNCHQPMSSVKLSFNDGRTILGKGYAEQLLMTIPPWKIPMDTLRWGRFGSEADHMVWIDLMGDGHKYWLWYNSKPIENVTITDDRIDLQKDGISLKMDKSIVLESEKKIYSVVRNLMKYIPGINSMMPTRFLMADEVKWLSKSHLEGKNGKSVKGWTIHELVDFRVRSK